MKVKDKKNKSESRESHRFVMVGHVDHGKSTIVGRLLADTNSLPLGKLEEIEKHCLNNSKPFQYAFLVDALKDERAQGITIDFARVFFHTKNRDYIILDAPGHIEFLKNMITGAAYAQSAFLVIDAKEGIKENSKRHAFMLAFLGIKKIAVIINKMDIVKYKKKTYDEIVKRYTVFLKKINIMPDYFIPVSAVCGDNIVFNSPRMGWYKGKTVIEALDFFEEEKALVDLPLRLPVQDIYKFTQGNNGRRTIAGTILTGKIKEKDEIIFYPSGKRNRVKSIEKFPKKRTITAVAGEAIGVTLEEESYVKRGELICKVSDNLPLVSCDFAATIFWLGVKPLICGKQYTFKIGTQSVKGEIVKIINKLDVLTLKKLSNAVRINKNEVAKIEICVNSPIVFDVGANSQKTSRFVIVDDYEISGGGIIISKIESKKNKFIDANIDRNFHWIKSAIPRDERVEKYGQIPQLIVITGQKEAKRKEFARKIESKLFEEGKKVYFLGMGSVIYGLSSDIKDYNRTKYRQEYIRRLSEMANVLLDAGLIVIVSASDLKPLEMEIIKMVVNGFFIVPIWLGAARKRNFVAVNQPKNIERVINEIIKPLDGARESKESC